MKLLILFGSLISLLLFSCIKDKNLNSYSVETYSRFLDSLNLHCPEGESDNYFEGTIGGEDVCFKDGIENYRFKFGLFSSIVTESPTLIIGGNNSNLMNLIGFRFQSNPETTAKPILSIYSPFYNPNRSVENYMDSLFSIKYHKIRSINDGEELVRDPTKFVIELRMIDYEDGRANAFPISSKFGKQEDSYLKIEKVEKTDYEKSIHYSLRMKLNCNLYHKALFGRKGLWRKIEDGIIDVNFTVNK